MKVTLILKNNFPATISTRNGVIEFCKNLELSLNNEFTLDFSEIYFISRSCADEFVKTFTKTSCKWNLINYNAYIKSMFDAVIHTQNSMNTDYENVAITPFLNQKDLNKFLSVI
jgi:hypothetical protein